MRFDVKAKEFAQGKALCQEPSLDFINVLDLYKNYQDTLLTFHILVHIVKGGCVCAN